MTICGEFWKKVLKLFWHIYPSYRKISKEYRTSIAALKLASSVYCLGYKENIAINKENIVINTDHPGKLKKTLYYNQ